MGLISSIGPLLSGLGLSSAAGLNAYVPLLAVGILARLGIVHLEGPYVWLANWTTLTVLGVLAIIDFIADKVPAVDHAMHVVGAVVHPAAGAIVFASQNGVIGHIPPPIALAAGVIVAGSFHATRAALRPASTFVTGGIATPFISLFEDFMAVVLTLLAVFVPLAAGALFLVLVVALVKSWRTVWERLTRLRAGQPVRSADK